MTTTVIEETSDQPSSVRLPTVPASSGPAVDSSGLNVSAHPDGGPTQPESSDKLPRERTGSELRALVVNNSVLRISRVGNEIEILILSGELRGRIAALIATEVHAAKERFSANTPGSDTVSAESFLKLYQLKFGPEIPLLLRPAAELPTSTEATDKLVERLGTGSKAVAQRLTLRRPPLPKLTA